MTSLIRTKIDHFDLNKCYNIADIENINEKTDARIFAHRVKNVESFFNAENEREEKEHE